MLQEATQSGADLNHAATKISNLFDAPEAPPKEDTEQTPAEQSAETHDDAIPEAQDESATDDVAEDASIAIPEDVDTLAQSLGVDSNALMNLRVKTKVDGVEGQATLADLIKSYQLESHLNNKSMQMAEARRQAEAEIAQHKAAVNAQIEQNASMLHIMQNDLMREYTAIDWQELRETDPAEYSAKRADFAERDAAIKQHQYVITQQIQGQLENQQRAQAEHIQQVAKSEAATLLSKLPEWANSEKAQAERQEICSYLRNQGFQDGEISSVIDHRQVLMARKAMLYDKLISSKPAVTKKTAVLPKVIKPGTVKTKSDIQAEQHAQHLSRLKKSGNVNDAAAALMNIL